MLRKQIARCLSFLLLLAFGWTQAETALHAWLHRNEPHCTAAEKHFHVREHHCAACDMIVSVADAEPPQAMSFMAVPLLSEGRLFPTATVFSPFHQQPSLRGPPVFLRMIN